MLFFLLSCILAILIIYITSLMVSTPVVILVALILACDIVVNLASAPDRLPPRP